MITFSIERVKQQPAGEKGLRETGWNERVEFAWQGTKGL